MQSFAGESAGSGGTRSGGATNSSAVEGGIETGMARETILQTAMERSDEGCRLGRTIRSLRSSARPGGSNTEFDVPATSNAQALLQPFGEVVRVSRRAAVFHVSITDSQAVNSSTAECQRLVEHQARFAQFLATTRSFSLTCVANHSIEDSRSNVWRFDMDRTSTNEFRARYLIHRLYSLEVLVRDSEDLRVNGGAGRTGLLREIEQAKRHLQQAHQMTAQGVFLGIEPRRVAIERHLNQAIAGIRRVHTAVNDGTRFPQGCSRSAEYVRRIHLEGS